MYNWIFWTVVLEKTLESPLDCKEIQPVHPKGDQSWVFIGRTDAKAERKKKETIQSTLPSTVKETWISHILIKYICSFASQVKCFKILFMFFLK